MKIPNKISGTFSKTPEGWPEADDHKKGWGWDKPGHHNFLFILLIGALLFIMWDRGWLCPPSKSLRSYTGSVLSATGGAELPVCLQWRQWTLQQTPTLRVGTGGKERQWLFLRGSFLSLWRQDESSVPCVSAQSVLTGYVLSVILNGLNNFSFHISTFYDGSENPPQPYESYFATMQFNSNSMSFPWARMALT